MEGPKTTGKSKWKRRPSKRGINAKDTELPARHQEKTKRKRKEFALDTGPTRGA